jgi:hypothetical protein
MYQRTFARISVGLAAVAALALLGACASSVKTAVPQSVQIKDTAMTFGGTYDPRTKDLMLSVNGDPVLRGTFPPYTPTTQLNGSHRGNVIRAECYFASNVNNSVGGIARVVASQVQSARGKAGDECKVFVNGTQATSLYF